MSKADELFVAEVLAKIRGQVGEDKTSTDPEIAISTKNAKPVRSFTLKIIQEKGINNVNLDTTMNNAWYRDKTIWRRREISSSDEVINSKLKVLRNVQVSAESAIKNGVILSSRLCYHIWQWYMALTNYNEINVVNRSAAEEIAQDMNCQVESVFRLLCQIRDVKHYMYMEGINEPEVANRNDMIREKLRELDMHYLDAEKKYHRKLLEHSVANEAEMVMRCGVSLTPGIDTKLWDTYCKLLQVFSTEQHVDTHPMHVHLYPRVVSLVAALGRGDYQQVLERLQLIRALKRYFHIVGLHMEDGTASYLNSADDIQFDRLDGPHRIKPGILKRKRTF